MHKQEPINNTIYPFSISVQKKAKNQHSSFSGAKRFHSHNYYEIIYINSPENNAVISFPEKSYQLTANTFILIPPNTKHLLPEACIGEQITIQMTDDYIKHIFDFLKLDITDFFQTRIRTYSNLQIQTLQKVMLEISSEYDNNINYNENGKLAFLTAQFITLLQQSVSQETNLNIISHGITPIQIAEYLKNNYSEEISLDMLSKKYYVDKFIMAKDFKAVTGMTIIDFLTQIRLNHAKEYLENTKLSISDIAEAVGYTSAHYLSIVFKKKLGISPSDYRQNNSDQNKISENVLGIDLGGTNLKLGVINKKNEIIYHENIPTETSSTEKLVNQLITKCKAIIKKYPVNQIGIAVPGGVYGEYVNTSNLPLKKVKLHQMLQPHFKIPIKIANDANCATIGECVAGAGSNVNNFLMVTIGTGIGGGIIINKKLYKGRNNAGEFGMMSIDHTGIEYEPGRYGIWEKYASTSALLKMAEAEAKNNPESLLFSIYKKQNCIDCNTFFKAIDQKCPCALKIFDTYLKSLYVGLKNLIDVFDPEMIILAGGITNVGDKLLSPLLNKYDFSIPIKISKLKNDAGMIGAARIS